MQEVHVVMHHPIWSMVTTVGDGNLFLEWRRWFGLQFAVNCSAEKTSLDLADRGRRPRVSQKASGSTQESMILDGILHRKVHGLVQFSHAVCLIDPEWLVAGLQYVLSFVPETAMPVQRTGLGPPDRHLQQRLCLTAMKDICIVA